MAMTDQEESWLGNFQRELTTMSDCIMWARSQVEYYVNELYDVSLDDAALAEIDPSLTQAKLSGGVNFVKELIKLLDNEPVSQGDWQTNLDQARKL